MKILVTGSAGFIGSALSLRLLERGDEVIGVDNHNDYYDPSLKDNRLSRHIDNINYSHNRLDISNFDDFNINEAEHEFKPNETAERLKRREKQNIERFRAAQDREDNFAIEYYQYRISIDKLDLEKLKFQTKIHQLKQKYGK